MFRAQTVLIVGAGTSCEAGFPIGDQLLTQIAGFLTYRFEHGYRRHGDEPVFEAITRIATAEKRERNDFLRAAAQIVRSAGQSLSIDNLIDALQDEFIERMGKIGIARAILAAEAGSHPFRRVEGTIEDLDLSRFNDTWYRQLALILTENARKDQVRNVFSNLKIINFNYDRTIEQYLPYALVGSYGIELAEARAIVDKLPILRPYGRVGKLPWQSGDEVAVEFGSTHAPSLIQAASMLRTFTEQFEDQDQLAAIHQAINGADRLICLGFAYHRQNVELLATPMKDEAEILGTCMNISHSDQSVIVSELREAFGLEEGVNRIELADRTCGRFFNEYRRTLTAKPTD